MVSVGDGVNVAFEDVVGPAPVLYLIKSASLLSLY